VTVLPGHEKKLSNIHGHPFNLFVTVLKIKQYYLMKTLFVWQDKRGNLIYFNFYFKVFPRIKIFKYGF
jgi:hypothetical protein